LNFLEKYENYLRDKPKGFNGKITKPNSINTIHSNLKFIRQIVNEAIRRDLLNHSDNPFLKKQLKTEKTEREYLNEDQIKELEEIELTTGSLELARDMFVFSCYTGGIRISDLLLLRVSDFDSTHLKYKVRKTKDQMHIKLPDKSMSIFKKYSKRKDKECYLFNYISNNIDDSNPELLDKSIAKSTVLYNNNLKKIAIKLNWKVKMSSHVARHTFATRALAMGMEVYTVSKILGHQSVKQTEVYLRIMNQTLDNAMDKFNL
jgi:integrase